MRLVNSEFVTESQYCFPSNLRNPLITPIYQLSYCPVKVTTVADLTRYPVCCIHPYVWDNVNGVKEQCCSEHSFCEFNVFVTPSIPTNIPNDEQAEQAEQAGTFTTGI